MWEFAWISNARFPRRRALPLPSNSSASRPLPWAKTSAGSLLRNLPRAPTFRSRASTVFAKSSTSKALRTSRSSSSAWQPRRVTDATWISTFPSTPRPPPRRLWSAWRGSIRPRWPKRRSCSTPHSSTRPPNSSCAPAPWTSIRARIICIQRECSAIACFPPAKARRATTVSRRRCVRRSPRAPTMWQSLSPTAALPPTSGKSCQSFAADMSR